MARIFLTGFRIKLLRQRFSIWQHSSQPNFAYQLSLEPKLLIYDASALIETRLCSTLLFMSFTSEACVAEVVPCACLYCVIWFRRLCSFDSASFLPASAGIQSGDRELDGTYMFTVLSSILIDEQCPLTSALNFARCFLSDTCHLTLEAVSLKALPEPPSFKRVRYIFICSQNRSMQLWHSFAQLLAVMLRAIRSADCSLDSHSHLKWERASSRLDGSRTTAWYSAEEPRLLLRHSTRSLTMIPRETMSPKEPKLTGIVCC